MIMSDADGNFVSEKFKEFYKRLNMEKAVSYFYHHESNGQVEVCIKFINQTLKKCMHTNADLHITLLQIRSTPLGQGLPNPVTLLFNSPIRDFKLKINRSPINTNNEDDNYETLVEKTNKS